MERKNEEGLGERERGGDKEKEKKERREGEKEEFPTSLSIFFLFCSSRYCFWRILSFSSSASFLSLLATVSLSDSSTLSALDVSSSLCN